MLALLMQPYSFTGKYIGVYAALGVVASLTVAIGSLLTAKAAIHASRLGTCHSEVFNRQFH